MTIKIYRSPFPDLQLAQTDLISFLFANPFETPFDRKIFVDAITEAYYTYRDVRERTDIIARGLADLGVRAGQRVAVFSPNSIDYAIFCYAIIRSGAACAPINAALTWQELRQQLTTAGSECMFVHSSLVQTAMKAIQGTAVKFVISDFTSNAIGSPIQISLAQLIERGKAAESLTLPTITNPDDPAFTCFSSGTTGVAKGVLTSHGNMTANLQQWRELYSMDSRTGSSDIAFLPFSHIYALNVFVCGGIYFGNTVVVMPHFDFDLYLRCIDKYRPTDLYLVPPVALRLVQDPQLDKYNLSSVKRIMSAAAPLSSELGSALENKLNAKYGHSVYCFQSWGLTETSPLATGVPLNRMEKRQTVGCIAPNMEFRVVDHVTGEDVQEAKSGDPVRTGEIWCRGPNVTRGYLNNSVATQEAFSVDADGKTWFKTGDIGSIDNDGFLNINDRIKEMIKYKGLQVIPSELEGKLLEHNDIEDCAVTARYDEKQATELPVAFIVLKQGVKSQPSEDCINGIHRWINAKVANYKRLRGGIYIVDSIPKSPSGKILRRQLREKFTGRSVSAKL